MEQRPTPSSPTAVMTLDGPTETALSSVLVLEEPHTITIHLVAHQMLSTLTVRIIHSPYGTMWCMTSIHWAQTALSHLHWEVRKALKSKFFDDVYSTCDLYAGSCIEAGYTECCADFLCLGSPTFDCFCDPSCHAFGDCCYDIDESCPPDVSIPPSRKFNMELCVLGVTVTALGH